MNEGIGIQEVTIKGFLGRIGPREMHVVIGNYTFVIIKRKKRKGPYIIYVYENFPKLKRIQKHVGTIKGLSEKLAEVDDDFLRTKRIEIADTFWSFCEIPNEGTVCLW